MVYIPVYLLVSKLIILDINEEGGKVVLFTN